MYLEVRRSHAQTTATNKGAKALANMTNEEMVHTLARTATGTKAEKPAVRSKPLLVGYYLYGYSCELAVGAERLFVVTSSHSLIKTALPVIV